MTELDRLLQDLAEWDEDSLEAQLGSRTQSIGEDLTQSRSVSIEDLAETPVPRGIMDDVLIAGRRVFTSLNPTVYNLLCTPLGGEDADETLQELVKILDTNLDENIAKAAGILTPFLTTNLGLAPAIAALVSLLIVKRVSKGVSGFTCDAWKKTLTN